MLFEMFVVGTFWFWALMLAEFIVLIYLLEHERYVAAPFTMLIVAAIIFFGGSGLGDGIRWVYHNPVYTVAGIIGYFLIGTVYVISPYFGKWWWFVRDVRDNNREAKQKWLSNWKSEVALAEGVLRDLDKHNIDPQTRIPFVAKETNVFYIKAEKTLAAWKNSNGVMTEELLPLWKEYQSTVSFRDWFGRQVSIEKPTPDKFKARITAWIAYWPPSLFWTLLNDPLRRIGRMIYEGVADVLKKSSDSAWKDEDKLG